MTRFVGIIFWCAQYIVFKVEALCSMYEGVRVCLFGSNNNVPSCPNQSVFLVKMPI